MEKNGLYQAIIEDISSEGSGVAKIDGAVVFVPGTAVGDKITLRILKVSKNCAFGRVEQILEPSSDRVENTCPIYGRCGGCDLRHISYEAEKKLKSNIVYQNLTRIGKAEGFVFNPLLCDGVTEGCRNKAQFPVCSENGVIRCGLYAKRSHRVVATENCLLQPAVFSEICADICAYATEYGLTAYDEESKKGLLRHIYLRCGGDGQIMVCLVINAERLPHSNGLVKLLTEKYPRIKSICANINRGDTNVILGQRTELLWGERRITDRLCGLDFDISANSFYQVNTGGAQLLYDEAGRLADPSGEETLLDLYCGTGTIGLSLARRVKQVIGAEIVEAAVEDARQNARRNNIENARFITGDAAEAAQRLAAEGIAPDIVILDPPRKGCDGELIKTVVAMQPKKVVYVSCDSATLSRDVAEFARGGYKLTEATPVDMFPRTCHVETVALLLRCN